MLNPWEGQGVLGLTGLLDNRDVASTLGVLSFPSHASVHLVPSRGFKVVDALQELRVHRWDVPV